MSSGELSRNAERLLGELTPAQRLAATHGAGPMLVVAGPGSGKTRTLTARLAYLVESGQAAPEELVAVTFTRKAAAEVRGRLQMLLGERAAAVTVGTFHAVAHALCQAAAPGPVFILQEGDRLALLRRAAHKAGVPPRRLVEAMDLCKGNLRPLPEELEPGRREYQALLDALGAWDLDDLLLAALAGVRAGTARPRWRFVSVDEYQDTNRVQSELVAALAGASTGRNVFAIGDPDQAIYAFRGADVRNFHAFSEDFPGARVVLLSENFRSTRTIVAAAASLLGREAAAAGRGAGAPIVCGDSPSEAAEAEGIVAEIERLVGGTSMHSHDTGRAAAAVVGSVSFSDIAVLVRTGARADALAVALDRAGIPIQRPRRSRLHSEEARDLLAYLRFVSGDDDRGARCHARVLLREAPAALDRGRVGALEAALAFPGPLLRLREALRALSLPERVTALAAQLETPEEALRAVEQALERHGEALVMDMDDERLAHESDELDPRAERVSVLTLHGSKGLEFPVVFLAGCEAALLPGAGATPPEVEEERRLFYVGMTRARDRLYLSYARRGRKGESAPSPFLGEIDARHLLTGAPRLPPRRKKTDQLKLL